MIRTKLFFSFLRMPFDLDDAEAAAVRVCPVHQHHIPGIWFEVTFSRCTVWLGTSLSNLNGKKCLPLGEVRQRGYEGAGCNLFHTDFHTNTAVVRCRREWKMQTADCRPILRLLGFPNS